MSDDEKRLERAASVIVALVVLLIISLVIALILWLTLPEFYTSDCLYYNGRFYLDIKAESNAKEICEYMQWDITGRK